MAEACPSKINHAALMPRPLTFNALPLEYFPFNHASVRLSASTFVSVCHLHFAHGEQSN